MLIPTHIAVGSPDMHLIATLDPLGPARIWCLWDFLIRIFFTCLSLKRTPPRKIYTITVAPLCQSFVYVIKKCNQKTKPEFTSDLIFIISLLSSLFQRELGPSILPLAYWLFSPTLPVYLLRTPYHLLAPLPAPYLSPSPHSLSRVNYVQ